MKPISSSTVPLARLGLLVGIEGLTFERIPGFLLAPVAWTLGVPWADAPRVAELPGIEVVLNEFLAYPRDGLRAILASKKALDEFYIWL